MDSVTTPSKPKLTRRRFLVAYGGAALTVGVGALDAVAVEPLWVRVTCPNVTIKGLSADWDGLRVAHLTDLHVGPVIDVEYIARVVELANAAQPDLVVITGDFVSEGGATMPGLVDALRALRGPMGRFGVLGNHDYWSGAPAVRSLLAEAGIEELTNKRRMFERRGHGLCVAGVDDLWEGGPDLAAALAGVPEAVPRILLCHNPDYAEKMPHTPRVDLMLCGHTHGGQVKIPFGPRPRLPIRHRRYAAGLVDGPCCQVYTSCGLGMVGIPIRFNCRPELAIVTLRRGA
jgi:predicted MPP superfamily phosphohydrolase